ncbi:MAG: DUF6970 domain-containing protein [Flavobacteriales bacterium]
MRERLYILFFFSCTLLISSCLKNEIANGTPRCIQKKIREFNKDAMCDDARVDEYQFQGGVVYVFEDSSCMMDGGSVVYSDNCDRIGFLGRISGNFEINGETFEHAVFSREIWHK